ncbi:MAG: hypothetical protein WCD53_28255 [Microcoleus sp.]
MQLQIKLVLLRTSTRLANHARPKCDRPAKLFIALSTLTWYIADVLLADLTRKQHPKPLARPFLHRSPVTKLQSTFRFPLSWPRPPQ